MKKRLGRSLVVLSAVSILLGLLAIPAQADPTFCTPGIDPLSITVVGQDVTIFEGRPSECVDVPDPDEIPTPQVTQDETGAYHVTVDRGAPTTFTRCAFGVNGTCMVWLHLT